MSLTRIWMAHQRVDLDGFWLLRSERKGDAGLGSDATLDPPKTRKCAGDRAYSVAAPRL